MLLPQPDFAQVTNRMSREFQHRLLSDTNAALLDVLQLFGESLPPGPEDLEVSDVNAQRLAKALILLAALMNLQDIKYTEQQIAKLLVQYTREMNGDV